MAVTVYRVERSGWRRLLGQVKERGVVDLWNQCRQQTVNTGAQWQAGTKVGIRVGRSGES